MKYSIKWVKETFRKDETLEYLFFWGHKPRNDGKVGPSCLSQWWPSPFEVDAINYPSAEHWMMAEKARLFDDNEALEKILVANSPAAVKKLGRQVRDFDPTVWNRHKYAIVKQGSIHKFSNNESIKAFLVSTERKVLVEASPYDKVWGIGLSKTAEHIDDPNTWQGDNLLGFALMEARDEFLD